MLELLLALAVIFVLAVMGRRNAPGLKDLQGWSYAHRGLHGEGVPENSMAAFQAALAAGYGIELDIHLTWDGDLAVIHDTALKRMTGRDVRITDLTAAELGDYRLAGTEQTIPTFHQVLDLFAGKAPMIIELKSDGNARQLVDTAVAAMAGYRGVWCMESFDPACVYYLKKNYPQVIRGQLSYNFFSDGSPLNPVVKFLLTHNLLNFLTQPDFVAYDFHQRRATPTTPIWQKLWKLQGVAWTLRTQEEYDRAVQEGWLPIFEGFVPE